MQCVRRLGGLAMVCMLGYLVAIAGAPLASAHVAPPDASWQNAISFSLQEVFGFAPRTGIFDINSRDTHLPTAFGFAFEGIATVNPICTDQVRENGGHTESWLIAVFTGAADVASINAQLMTLGLLQHNAQAFAVFSYGASLGDGSFGTLTQCTQPVGTEGLLVLSIYAQQIFNQAHGQFLNGELLYCSLNTTWADPNSFLEFCDSYFAFSNTSF